METKHPINDLMATTMQKIREMVDANTVIGAPIEADGVTIIPVSKISFGFASGGTDFTGKNQKSDSNNPFGGGGGAGANVMPIAFLIVKDGNVRILPVTPPPGTTLERAVEMVPGVVDKVTDFVEKQQARRAEDKDTL